MRLTSYVADGGWRAGLVVDAALVDAQVAAAAVGLAGDAGEAELWRSPRRLIQEAQPTLRELDGAARRCAERGDALMLGEVALGPPIRDPEKIIGLGLNYGAHAKEVGAEPPIKPNLFAMFASSLLGPEGTILIPPVTDAVDFEGELAFVVGRPCKNVSAEEALDHVAGCMAFNDVTARDLQRATSQWTAGKAIDTFAPSGPALVTLDELGDPSTLGLRTRVNGELVQDARTSEMIFSIPDTIAFVSQLMTLVPGDIVTTGTPEGVGFRRDPPMFLAPGDVVEVEIDGIGTLRNGVSAGMTATR